MSEAHAVLANYPPDCQPTHIESLGSAGGMSGAQFWRISSSGGKLILRRWPTEHPPPERLRFIYAVLVHAATRGCHFLPLPVTTSRGQSFVEHAGHLWELGPFMPGTADYEQVPSLEKLRAAMRALAQFHNAAADFPLDSTIPTISATQRVAGAPPAHARHLTRLHDLTTDQINDLSRSIRDTTWPDLAPLARQFVAILPRAVPHAIALLEPLANARLPLQPCLRDIWQDHVLFTDDDVTGLIDFGAIDIDTPATDIARLLGSLSPSTPDEAQTWREGLAAYNAVRPLSSDETCAAHALNTSGTILAGCNWIRWIYIEGLTFENHAQVIERFRRILARCELA